jgi:hypothetical protein
VASHALVEARLSAIAALRDRPVPAGAPVLPPRFLRHCDEQTVVGMRAVLAAIAGHPAPRPAFDRYGVIGSSWYCYHNYPERQEGFKSPWRS